MSNRLMLRRMQPRVNPFVNAILAFSFDDLNLGATNIIKARRSSDNSEQDFTATEITDGTLTTFCGGGDGFLVVWYNQKGSNHFRQNSAALQPKIVESGSLILENTKLAIKFTGSEILELDTSTTYDEIYIVVNAQDFTRIIGASTVNRFIQWRTPLDAFQYNQVGATILWDIPTYLKDSVQCLINSNTTDSTGYINNTQPDNALTIVPLNLKHIGGDNNTPSLIGNFQELITFDTNENDTDNRNEIINRYNINI